MWQNGTSPTPRIGYINRNQQKNHGHRNIEGTDYGQLAYRLECLLCGHEYGANGSDIFQHKYPDCQGALPGIEY